MKRLLVFGLLCWCSTGQGQSLYHQYKKLSRPEKWWIITHLFSAAKAWQATVQTRTVVEQCLAHGVPDTIRNGGKIDAFRHAYWMASVSRKIGEKRARKLGLAHEKGNYLTFKKGKMDDGALPDSLSGVMDLFNNEAGLTIARAYNGANDDFIGTTILNSIERGQLKMLKHRPDGTLTDCTGNPVPTLPVWNRPYCLIPTYTP